MDTVEDIQELCFKNSIEHFVMFDDLYPSKRQVQVSEFHLLYIHVYVYAIHTVHLQLWTMEDKTFTDKKVRFTISHKWLLHVI